MKYFDSLPLIAVTNGNSTQVYRNIMSRLSVIPSILQNPLLYYTYDLKDTDTPEIVAEKYYGDAYRYWIVLFSNQYFDAQWDWPLSSLVLEQYITDKYAQLNISPNDAKSYQKSISKQNSTTGLVVTEYVEITSDEYNNLVPYSKTLTFPSETVIVSVDKRIQSFRDYEIEKNESKRNIKLLNRNYVSQLESEFKELMK